MILSTELEAKFQLHPNSYALDREVCNTAKDSPTISITTEMVPVIILIPLAMNGRL